jgi:hypothetical protein
MRSFFIVFSCLTALLIFSCEQEVDNNPPLPLPGAVLIDFTFKNETQSPVAVKIRHKYQWQWEEWLDGEDVTTANTAYTEWSTEDIGSGESKAVGVEKTTLINAKSTQEVSGFILLDRYTANISQAGHIFFSSFELEIETADKTLFISDQEIYDRRKNDTELLYLRIYNPYNTCHLITLKQGLEVRKTFIVPVNLTLKQDGSLSVEHETINSGNGIHIFFP